MDRLNRSSETVAVQKSRLWQRYSRLRTTCALLLCSASITRACLMLSSMPNPGFAQACVQIKHALACSSSNRAWMVPTTMQRARGLETVGISHRKGFIWQVSRGRLPGASQGAHSAETPGRSPPHSPSCHLAFAVHDRMNPNLLLSCASGCRMKTKHEYESAAET